MRLTRDSSENVRFGFEWSIITTFFRFYSSYSIVVFMIPPQGQSSSRSRFPTPSYPHRMRLVFTAARTWFVKNSRRQLRLSKCSPLHIFSSLD